VKRVWIRLWISGFAMAASVALGIFLVSWGNHLAAQNYDYDVAPRGTWGAFFLALPLIVGVAWLLAAIVRTAAAEHQRYRAWKARLTPEQRAAVELAEAAATAAVVAMWEHHKRTDARLTSSVMGRTMPDGHTPRPSQRIEAYRQQAPLAPGPVAQDPTAASQAVIARHHPEHLDPRTGEYRIVPW